MRRFAVRPNPGGRDLSLYWWGQTTSVFGSVLSTIAMPIIAVVYLNASPAAIGVITAAGIVPRLVLGLPAGVFADRIIRPRQTLLVLDTISAIAVAAVGLGVATHVASVAWLIALALVEGCVLVLLEVVYFIHLRQVAGDAAIGPARAKLQAGQYAAGFVGRVLAGPTILVFGAGTALIVDAVSYLLSAAALLAMTPVAALVRPAAARSRLSIAGGLRAVRPGLRLFYGDPFRRALLVLLFVPGVAAAGVGALTAPFLLRVLLVPTSVYGLLFAASGLMGLAGSVLAGRLLSRDGNPRIVLLACNAGAVVSTMLLPLASGPLPVAIGSAVLGISLPTFFGSIGNVALTPVIVADVAEDAMGRTIAALQVIGGAAGLIGALAGGAAGQWIGVRSGLWLLDVAALVGVGVCLPGAVRAARGHQDTSISPEPVSSGERPHQDR